MTERSGVRNLAAALVATAFVTGPTPTQELGPVRYQELSHEVELSSSVTRSLAQVQRILNTAAPDSHPTFAVSTKN
jgi:hypothetical protein